MTHSKAPTLLVLAAGIGSRFGGLKQMEPIGPSGEALIDYSVYDALRAGFEHAVFIVRQSMADDFRALVGYRFERRMQVTYVYQEVDQIPAPFLPPEGRTKPWGTAQAVLCARDAIRTPFVTINADDFYGREGFQLLAQHFASGSEDCAMAGFVLGNTLSEFGRVARGVCRVSPDGYLEDVVERTGIVPEGSGARDAAAGLLTGDETVSMNMWAFTPSVFDTFASEFERFLARYGSTLDKECYLPNVVNTLIGVPNAGEDRSTVPPAVTRVKVLPTRESWFGVTYREDMPRVTAGIRALIDAGAYPNPLWELVA
ncbi:MAG TPA: sugar phosphate nucleotidyltransferase [Acidobacteriaceae bacterium]|nr:sugar phosphate nucleotidyltransferase [Acidobacteriaceae bacterium]